MDVGIRLLVALPQTTRETVEMDTPAALATSRSETDELMRKLYTWVCAIDQTKPETAGDFIKANLKQYHNRNPNRNRFFFEPTGGIAIRNKEIQSDYD